MFKRMLEVTLPVCAAVVVSAARLANAGDLNPPAGPVAPTMKTLAAIEPRIEVNDVHTPGDNDATPSKYKISQPGSYYLGGNVIGDPGKTGVEIAAADVSLDLMGFRVSGSIIGIRVTAAVSNVTIRNGTIRDCGLDGIEATNATGTHLQDLRVSNNGAFGITVGAGAVVTNCTATANGSEGGFQIGISAGDRSVITGCSVFSNADDGLQAINGSTITACTAGGNGGRGIIVAAGCIVTACTTFANTGNGIDAGPGDTVRGCTSSGNTGHGINITNDCYVAENTCDGNGNNGDGAGIHAAGSDNRIDGNNCTDNDRGIDVDFTGNFIARNTCEGNTTNWDIAAGNVCLVVNAATAGAITGNSGGTAPGSTDPNANFSY